MGWFADLWSWAFDTGFGAVIVATLATAFLVLAVLTVVVWILAAIKGGGQAFGRGFRRGRTPED